MSGVNSMLMAAVLIAGAVIPDDNAILQYLVNVVFLGLYGYSVVIVTRSTRQALRPSAAMKRGGVSLTPPAMPVQHRFLITCRALLHTIESYREGYRGLRDLASRPSIIKMRTLRALQALMAAVMLTRFVMLGIGAAYTRDAYIRETTQQCIDISILIGLFWFFRLRDPSPFDIPTREDRQRDLPVESVRHRGACHEFLTPGLPAAKSRPRIASAGAPRGQHRL